jgi:hypothetical protein
VQASYENPAADHDHLQRMLFQEHQPPKKRFPRPVWNVDARIQKRPNLRQKVIIDLPITFS